MNYAKFKETLSKQSCLKKKCINLIASENIPSAAMLSALHTDLDNRYPLDDFPNNNFLRQMIKELESDLCSLFSCQYADCSPLSGMNCMELIIVSLTEANDNVYIIPPMAGGHASTAKNVMALGRQVNYLPIDAKTQDLDEIALEQIFEQNCPRLIYLDNTLICSFHSPEPIVRAARKHNAFVVYDASQVLGLIAGQVFPNPLNYGIDCLCGSTHKTFFGPQKGVILSNSQSVMQRIKAVAVDFISSVHTNSILALYVATMEMQKFGKEYAAQIVSNSKALGQRLYERGICVPTYRQGVSQTHQVWISLDNPQWGYDRLSECGINTNCMRIPAIEGIGIRMGTAEITRLGMKEKEMAIIADCIADALHNKAKKRINARINDLLQCFNRVCYSMEEEELSHILQNQHYSFHTIHNINFNNIINDFESLVLRPIPHYSGMIIRGGVGRGTCDQYSDIDFTCILDVDDAESFRKSIALKRGMFRYKGVMFSARYMTVNEFINGSWSDKMKHAYQFSKTIHCTQPILDAVKSKTTMSMDERRSRILSNLIDLGEMCRIYPKLGDFEMFSEIYKHYRRQEFTAAHVTIDLALKYIKNILFALNGIYYPEEKSYYTRFFSNLPIQPPKIEIYIQEILAESRTPETIALRLEKLVYVSRIVLRFIKTKIDIPNDLYRNMMNN